MAEAALEIDAGGTVTERELTHDERRHLLRRLCFAARPREEASLRGGAVEAFDTLWTANRAAPEPPLRFPGPWTNTALALAAASTADRDARRAEQLRTQQAHVDELREAWIESMALGAAPLRENLTLFLHGLFGSASAAVEIPQALEARNALLRRACMTSFPALLEELVLDPAMLIQIGMDGHGPDRVSDRPAKLILEHWTVGPGEYADADVGELSRALTGWSLGGDGAAAGALDPRASAAERRTGLVPRFDPARFEAGPKQILGVTRDFDARSALRFLALQPATARRFGRALVRHFGVADPGARLERDLEAQYLASAGSTHEVVRALVASPELWSEGSRWSLIKSPAHLAAGACRQLELDAVPAAALRKWLGACGQTLFDTPNNGEGGWPDREAWITPPDRLALRYELAAVLEPAPDKLGSRSARDWLERLDPAPGLNSKLLHGGARDAAWQIMTTPQYQLA